MIKIKHLLFISLLLIPKASFGQTHYCDTVPPTTGSGIVGTPEQVSACLAATDTGGSPVTPTNWTLYVDAATGVPITMTKVSTSPVSNKSLYQGTFTPTTVGNHTLTITATGNAKESVKSTSFLLSISNPPAAPQAPTNLTTN